MVFCWKRDERVQRIEYLVGDRMCGQSLDKLPNHEQKLFHLAEHCLTASRCSDSSENEYGSSINLFQPKEKIQPISLKQTYRHWKASQDLVFRFRRMRTKQVICLQPLEELPDFLESLPYSVNGLGKAGILSLLRDFLMCFFDGFEVKQNSVRTIADFGWHVTERIHPKTSQSQLLVTDINKNIGKATPQDSFCMLAVTWTDLYPAENLNFVLGEASAHENAGTFCFGRYEPKAFEENQHQSSVTTVDGKLIWRMFKVVSHETCHIFGLAHCVFFECAMNASTSIQEAMSQPLFLCPVCLRKLQKACQFHLEQRYNQMYIFLSAVNEQFPCEELKSSVTWLQRMLQFVKHNKAEVEITY